MTDRRTLTLLPSDGEDHEIGRWLLALADTRSRLDEALNGVPEELVDTSPSTGGSSIGTILYHVAAIEADWLFDEILGTIDTDWPAELFPKEVREDGQHITPFLGESLDQHRDRLRTVRTMLLDTVRVMSVDELHQPRRRAHYDVSPAWVLHHLMQHEAEHRSQIGSVRAGLGASSGW